jgi:DNA-binding transcriptional ArsR family regulator
MRHARFRGVANQRTVERLDRIFSALADPVRRSILARLAHGESSVTEVALPFSISGPAISRHLKILERAGLVCSCRGGRPLNGVYVDWIPAV